MKLFKRFYFWRWVLLVAFVIPFCAIAAGPFTLVNLALRSLSYWASEVDDLVQEKLYPILFSVIKWCERKESRK